MGLILTLLVIGALNAWMGWEMAGAPRGYEDEKGFHYND